MMPDPIDFQRIDTALRELLAAVPEDDFTRDGLSVRQAKRLSGEIRAAILRLRRLAQEVDPIRQPPVVFDPYLPDVLGQFVGRTMQAQVRVPLGDVENFYGSGVYAIYYRGDHAAYAPIRNTQTPVYAGKADPANTHAATPEEQGPRLAVRLSDHAKSISAAQNLRIEDFDCRFLVVKSGLQKAAEDYLLAHFRPVWNQPLCKGFGKHGDSAATRANTRSEWDTLHPGRRWALGEANVPNPKTPEEITASILAHYDAYPPIE